ncbi:MAG: DNA topoisomerase I [Candidatus Lloydbacteria bacterium CG22_combo_CG10-13_8_21_14_all_47_15]|uniref:DNA topoisomerase 1 n=1 Tax=Candidatus Lloydbacteria bacterium CG22_combo_CG10-13_8_21_14_all_47_15 TaxID=1974635 RepID=A0A2H0CUY9_9BACT|nr:MAG: DNA topoisomerase I [Candidatus Lloydbacteria bacterium CG22_combo_CG10-13_8_21_14_all_47_15]
MKKLVIVESPSKTKTISKYLGSNFVVRASVGHIRDLPKNNKQAIDIEHGFLPHYEIPKEKASVVSNLKKDADRAVEILLATDPDREGEAIAWHIMEALSLPASKTKRIVFHEITKRAVEEAIAHPREIDEHLRRAQEARRVLDRLVGYELSGLIWKKVRYGLSAGRVQSPALRILMEREREIRAFVPETYFTLRGTFSHNSGTLTLTAIEEPREKKEAERIVSEGTHGVWSVTAVTESEMKRTPRAPFITSTLQQAASSRLGFSPSRTMGIAQKLYEAGHITYMRTDSTSLAMEAENALAQEVVNRFGTAYSTPRKYKTKSKNAQEAHEAIRPTDPKKMSAGTTPEQKKLYELIWRRAISSQMTDALLAKTKITANITGGTIPDFVATGSSLKFDGWLAADPTAHGEDVILPSVAKGDPLALLSLDSEEKETQPPTRYTEAGLVKELEKRGIGRPSTYATIMKTLADRGYAEKEGKTLHPTDTGEVVSTFLEEHFSQYISDSFTAEMEEKLDEIAGGTREYVKTLSDFYTPFHKDVESKEDIPKVTTLGDAPEDVLCPECGKRMVIKLGRSGKFLSCAEFPKCSGSRTIEGKVIPPPKEIGEDCPECTNGKLVEREGKYGRFISCGNYPKCKYVKKDPTAEAKNDTGIPCPVCKKGTMVERHGRFGTFYSCSNYPKCKHAIKARPTGAFCTECDSLMMEGTKTIPERCSNKACPNHNPHKHKK